MYTSQWVSPPVLTLSGYTVGDLIPVRREPLAVLEKSYSRFNENQLKNQWNEFSNQRQINLDEGDSTATLDLHMRAIERVFESRDTWPLSVPRDPTIAQVDLAAYKQKINDLTYAALQAERKKLADEQARLRKANRPSQGVDMKLAEVGRELDQRALALPPKPNLGEKADSQPIWQYIASEAQRRGIANYPWNLPGLKGLFPIDAGYFQANAIADPYKYLSLLNKFANWHKKYDDSNWGGPHWYDRIAPVRDFINNRPKNYSGARRRDVRNEEVYKKVWTWLTNQQNPPDQEVLYPDNPNTWLSAYKASEAAKVNKEYAKRHGLTKTEANTLVAKKAQEARNEAFDEGATEQHKRLSTIIKKATAEVESNPLLQFDAEIKKVGDRLSKSLDFLGQYKPYVFAGGGALVGGYLGGFFGSLGSLAGMTAGAFLGWNALR